MILSDDQMGAVRHGLPIGSEPTWLWEELPIGPQPLPAWAKGLRVDFMMDYANRPDYRIKATTNLRRWDNKTFHREGSRYMALSGDGRAEVYYNNGSVTMTELRRFRAADGTLRQHCKHIGPNWDDVEPGEWVDVPMLATTQQQGFGGSQYELQMDDGTVVVLRGPWHGGAPAGYVEACYTNVADDYFRGRRIRDHKSPWWQITGRAGLFLTEDLFKQLLARFAPECRCARVTNRYGSHLEAVRGDWDFPKDWIVEQNRRAA